MSIEAWVAIADLGAVAIVFLALLILLRGVS